MTLSWVIKVTSKPALAKTVLPYLVGGLALVGVLAVLPLLLHAETTTGRWQTPFPAVALGAIIGMTYGLLGVGIVLIYRSNRIVNFAQGAMGAFVAAVFGVFAGPWHIPYWIAVVLALFVASVLGAVCELAIVRRLRRAPNVMSVVATLALGGFLISFAYSFNGSAGVGRTYPEPAGLPTLHLGALVITPAYMGMLILAPVVVVSLAVFLKRSRFGLAMRGAAANSDSARLAGVFASRTSTMAWSIAAVLAALTAILFQPTQGYVDPGTAGTDLLLPALGAAAVARMSSLPIALVAGVGFGVIDQLILWNYPNAGFQEPLLFVVVLLVFLLQRDRRDRTEDKSSWATVEALRPLPESLRQVWAVRNMAGIVAAVALAVAVVLPILVTNTTASGLTQIMALAVVGLSVGVVTGLAGQLTLGQFALAAVGGTVAYQVTSHGGNFLLAVALGGLTASVASLAIGLPALRLKGFVLAVTTLAFAAMTESWLLYQPWMLGNGGQPRAPVIFGYSLNTARTYYFVALVALVAVMWLVHNTRRSRLRLMFVAVRDNEEYARAFGLSPAGVKCRAFLLAGFIAGVGGTVYVHSLASVDASGLSSTLGGTAIDLSVVTMAVIGGISLLSGPLLGALVVLGLPTFVQLDAAALAASQLGLLVLILYVPRGVTQVIDPLRLWIAKCLARLSPRSRGEERVRSDDQRPLPSPLPRAAAPAAIGGVDVGVVLKARGLTKSYGGIRAVDGLSIEVTRHEILGVIGPNGAGKTTAFELLSGFTLPDDGVVIFEGRPITGLSPQARAHLGLVRSFQDAALFPTMTVQEVVEVALERRGRTLFFRSLLGLQGRQKRAAGDAVEIVDTMGLSNYRDAEIRELSTGTRRIVELACLVAMRPTLLLLDEPSSGIAQRETEQLGIVLRGLRDDLGITLIVIEHDMPLIMGLADRIIAMANGTVIATGTPREISDHSEVIAAYLGSNLGAIERSGERSLPLAVES
jgi:ABC-type branched-subunit amino acid transport system ATPase component/ABC-type branched-subunit amino acid transport system permease subunit